MKQSILGYFENYTDADEAVRELEQIGIGKKDISVIARKGVESGSNRTVRYDQDDDPIGAATGAVLGGLTGLLVGISGLVIPGIGPIIAAGPIAAALGAGVGIVSGAVTAPVLDGFMGLGLTREDAEAYVEGIKRGGIVVTVHAGEDRSDEIEDIFEECGASAIDEHAAAWKREGWPGSTSTGGEPEFEPLDDDSSRRQQLIRAVQFDKDTSGPRRH